MAFYPALIYDVTQIRSETTGLIDGQKLIDKEIIVLIVFQAKMSNIS